MSQKPQKRRSFTASQKADAVRKHLKCHIPVSEMADEMKVQPTMTHNWINSVLSQAEQVFKAPRSAKASSSKRDNQLQALRQKLDAKNQVIAELMEENILAKKWGSLIGRWIPHATRDLIVDYINYWNDRTELPDCRLLA